MTATAHFRIAVQAISRGKGRNVVAAAAYRSGDRLRDERQGLTFAYKRKEGILESRILAPEGAPEWALKRESLWNAADAAERRRDAITAREILVSLPHALDGEAHGRLLDGLARIFTDRGLVVDLAIHDSHGVEGKGENKHAHVLITDRPLENGAFAKGKDRTLSGKDGVEALREAWAELVNGELTAAGLDGRVDHRSQLRRWGEAEAAGDVAGMAAMEYIPEPKASRKAVGMAKGGKRSESLEWQAIDECRAGRADARARSENLAREMEDLARVQAPPGQVAEKKPRKPRRTKAEKEDLARQVEAAPVPKKRKAYGQAKAEKEAAFRAKYGKSAKELYDEAQARQRRVWEEMCQKAARSAQEGQGGVRASFPPPGAPEPPLARPGSSWEPPRTVPPDPGSLRPTLEGSGNQDPPVKAVVVRLADSGRDPGIHATQVQAIRGLSDQTVQASLAATLSAAIRQRTPGLERGIQAMAQELKRRGLKLDPKAERLAAAYAAPQKIRTPRNRDGWDR